MGSEGFRNPLGPYTLAVGIFEHDGLATVGLNELKPAFAELASDKHQGLRSGRDQVRDGGFHGSRSGTGQNDYVMLCLENITQSLLYAQRDAPELRAAVVDHCLGGSPLHGRRYGGGTWNAQMFCFFEQGGWPPVAISKS